MTEGVPTSPAAWFTCNADPVRTGDRAGRHFYIDSNSHDIRVNATQAATVSDDHKISAPISDRVALYNALTACYCVNHVATGF